MTRALWGVALLSWKVWHLIPWLAEHLGWGDIQSRPCSVGQLGSLEWCRVVSTIEVDTCWPTSLLICLHSDQPPKQHIQWSSLRTWDRPFPAVIESNGEAGDSSVKGIMDHYCLVQGTWHGLHASRVQQSTGVKGILTACYVLWAKWNSCHLTRIKHEKY